MAAVVFFSSGSDAHAYLDPVTGSYILQGLIGGIVAALVSFRSIRDRIFGLLRSKKRGGTGQGRTGQGRTGEDDSDRRA